jgi:hypothetical protein
MLPNFLVIKDAFAAPGTPNPTRFNTGGGANPNPACLQALETVFEKGLSTALWGVGIACFFAIIIGGIKYMTAGADDKAMGGAKQTITYGIIGLVIAVSAYALLNGLNLIIFRIPNLIKFDIPGTCS